MTRRATRNHTSVSTAKLLKMEAEIAAERAQIAAVCERMRRLSGLRPKGVPHETIHDPLA